MKKLAFLLLALAAPLFLQWHTTAAAEGYKVIVNRANPTTSISKSELSGLLLKKVSKWEHGVAADPVDLDSSSETRESFSRDVHGRSVASIKNYWQRQIFSGRDVPPPEVSSDAAVISFVESRPGAVGYVSSQARVDSVKVISVSDG
jgi:ABC-type phosphate transport system substrate-binding protein